ncbi:MAG: hypothetical protein ACLU22_03390 [Clostridium sp.]
MCRIKNLAILLGLCMVITACGSSEQQKSKVMLYQGDKNKKEEEHYKTTKVKKRHLRRENFGDSQSGLSE